MTRRILKWQFPANTTEMELELTGPVLHYGVQDNRMTVWVEEGTYGPVKTRLRIYGTGEEVETDSVYIGTVQVGAFVFHLYGKAVEA